MKKSEYLVQMEAAMKKSPQEIFLTEDDVYDSEKRQPPRFVTRVFAQFHSQFIYTRIRSMKPDSWIKST